MISHGSHEPGSLLADERPIQILVAANLVQESPAGRGLRAGGGPKGVGDAVNQSVVITFLLLFAVNFVITAIYFQLVPPKGQ